jgi:hypothetical protein
MTKGDEEPQSQSAAKSKKAKKSQRKAKKSVPSDKAKEPNTPVESASLAKEMPTMATTSPDVPAFSTETVADQKVDDALDRDGAPKTSAATSAPAMQGVNSSDLNNPGLHTLRPDVVVDKASKTVPALQEARNSNSFGPINSDFDMPYTVNDFMGSCPPSSTPPRGTTPSPFPDMNMLDLNDTHDQDDSHTSKHLRPLDSTPLSSPSRDRTKRSRTAPLHNIDSEDEGNRMLTLTLKSH